MAEGWFYEGAGIYRHVWLHKMSDLHVTPFGTFISSRLNSTYDSAVLNIETNIENSGMKAVSFKLRHILFDREGKEVGSYEEKIKMAKSLSKKGVELKIISEVTELSIEEIESLK